MIGNFTNLRRWGGVFCLTLAVCLVAYLMLKPTSDKQKNSDPDSLDNLVSTKLLNSINKQNKSSFVKKHQVASHTSAQALTVEEGIQNRYLDIFDEIPEANPYFEFLSKSGIPQQFHWRAFRVLHDIALRLGEYDHQVELLKSRLTEKELSGAETDPVTVKGSVLDIGYSSLSFLRRYKTRDGSDNPAYPSPDARRSTPPSSSSPPASAPRPVSNPDGASACRMRRNRSTRRPTANSSLGSSLEMGRRIDGNPSFYILNL